MFTMPFTRRMSPPRAWSSMLNQTENATQSSGTSAENEVAETLPRCSHEPDVCGERPAVAGHRGVGSTMPFAATLAGAAGLSRCRPLASESSAAGGTRSGLVMMISSATATCLRASGWTFTLD